MRLPIRRGVARRAASVRCRADRYALPMSESLEVREMLAAGPLGINVTGAFDFVDVMKEAEAWGSNGVTALTENAQGWPTSDAEVLVMDDRVNVPWNGPDPSAVSPDIGGTYHLSFQGQATISTPMNNFAVQNQVYNAQTNTTTADIVVQHNGTPMLYLDFTNTVDTASSTGAGVTNVVLIQPGYAANTTQVFATPYLNALAPFGTIRYLNADAANDYGVTWGANGLLQPLNWSQRTLPSDASQSQTVGGTSGIAWEYMVALANATNTDMWINIPGPASDDYVTQLAKLIQSGDTVNGVTYAGLNPNLKVYVEYSNEVWGGTYNPYAVNQQLANQEVAAGGSVLNSDGTTYQTTLDGRYYLQRTMQITNIFRSVMGNDPTYSKIRPVLGWQETDWPFYSQVLPWFESTYGAPRNYFYGLGDAIYLGASDYTSENSIITSMIADEAALATQTADFTTVANYYGMKTVAYEGGPAIGTSASATADANALAASRDPRMEQIVDQMYTNWYADGGDVANFYDGPFDTDSPGNEYALIELADEATPTLSSKFLGIEDLAASAPVAVTVGNAVSTSTSTVLPVSSDSLGQSFTNPSSGQSNFWTLNVATAGPYSLSLTTSNNFGVSQFQPGKVQVYLGDQQLIGTFSVTQSGTISLGTLNLPAGLSTLSIKTVNGYNDPAGQTTYQFQPTALVLNDKVQYANVGGAGYAETGTWAKDSGYDEASAGNGNATAAWSFTVSAGTYEVSADWPSSASNTTAATYQVSQSSVALSTGTPTVPTLGDPGFEAIQVGTSYSYDPTGSAWTFSGNAGVSGNGSTFTAANPSAPQGAQVAFIQQTGSFSQTVTGWAAGSYQLSFSAAQRGNLWYNVEDFRVLVDGVPVASFTPSGKSYQVFTTPTFSEAAGTHTITFQGINTAGYDDTAFIDNIAVVSNSASSGSASTAPTLGDTSFEADQVGTSYAYDPTGTPWSYSGNAGVTGNNSTFTAANPSAPQGTQVAFIQQTGSLSQTVTGWAAGSYQLSFSAAQRGNLWYNVEDFRVLVDGVPVASFTPSGKSYQVFTTPTFSEAAGTHTITFQGINTAGYDDTAFIDNVSLALLNSTGTGTGTTATLPPDPPLGDTGFEAAGVGYGAYVYDPTGTPWSYSGNAGLSGNNSTFTASDPSAPQGNAVAFIQQKGSISQTTTGWSTGTYQLSFSAAQRGNLFSNTEDFSILIDGQTVGTFTPSGKTYQVLTTPVFSEPAGTHTITIQGLDSIGGDNTAFIDNLTLKSVPASSNGSVADSSFEAASLAANSFVSDPNGTPWTYSGNAGVAANGSGYTSGNPSAPQGTQVAFLQKQGSFSQMIAGLATGNYQFSFSAAQRSIGGSANAEDFAVLVDGVAVATFKPLGSSYQTFVTPIFAISAGSHVITFQGLDSVGGDNTALIDNVGLNFLTSSVGGSSVLGTATENQTLSAVEFLDAGQVWQDLGGPYTVTGSTLTVTLANSPLGKVDAKSIRIEKLS